MFCRCRYIKKPTFNRFVGCLFAFLTSSTLFTASAETLSLSDAVRKTLATHPDLARYAHQAQISEGHIQQAGAATPMRANIMVENALGTGANASFKALQTTLSLSWLLEDDLLDSRINVATSQASSWQYEQKAVAIDLAAETARYFITLLSQQQKLALAKLAERQAKRLLASAAQRVDAGQTSTVDALRAQAYLASKTLVVEDLVHEIEATKAQLVAQWRGDVSEDALEQLIATGSLSTLPPIQPLAELKAQVKAHPRLRWFATQERIAQSQIQLAKMSAQPAWSVSTGVRRNEEIDDFSLMATLSIPFGGEHRNDGEIRALNALQNQQHAEAQAWQQRLFTQLLLLTHKLKHNHHVIEGLQKNIIPALEAAEHQAQRAYKMGSYRYSQWYEVQQELLAAKQQLIQAFTNMQLFNIELERLTGVRGQSS